MQAELSALEREGMWKLVDAPPNIKPIGCIWVYKVKFHADDLIEWFKVRLMDKGFNQIEFLNYFDTYSPVAKMTTVKMMIALTTYP